ncbi:MAG: hypothetical protein EPO10_14625 [Reyranella sp.]|uniref:hypothetical protein n=1 Tax=Reyranella sp. TaxID=1929291 RepID=UPI0012129587|nr:hypothetical protein [Reyranella sp.]TAJ97152.1 MAG: hypothetical protein EPO41_03940 [Reyranella sp.]TBR28129.1 MAG: hypothetical protein EPO10_14625 [Reyranella sp.]
MAPKDRVRPEPLTYERQGDTTVLRPQANPVDTFVRPTEPLKSSLMDVAQSLAQVQPKLDRFVSEKAHQQAIADARDAEAKAMVATSKSWDEAIKNGEAPAGASPLYRRVFEETQGKVHGLNTAQAQLWQEWVSPENTIRTTQDPEVIGKWFADRRKKFFDGKSNDWINGFSPAFAQVQQQLTQKIIGDNVKYIEQANHDALGQLFMERIMAGAASGQTPSQIAAQLADDALPQRFAGMQGKEINTIAAKAIISVAQKTGRTDLLQIGYSDRPDLKNPGGTIKGVFTIPEFSMQADAAQTAILSKANAAETRAQLAEARAEKRMGKDMMVELVEKKSADPNWEPDVEWKKRAARAGLSPTVLRAQLDASVRPPKSYDPVTFNTMALQYVDLVRSGKDATSAIEAMAPHLSAPQLLQMHKENDKGADSIFRSRVYTVEHDGLKGMVDKLTKSLDGPAANNRVTAALGDLVQFTLDEQRKMSAGGPIDLRKLEDAVRAKGQELRDRLIQENEGAFTDPNAPQGSKPGAKGSKPGQQAQGQPSNPNTVANAIPADRIVDASPQAQGYQFPPATTTTSAGMQIIATWQPPPGATIDIREINLLRMNPMALNAEGVPLWKRFDETYGVGASRYFATNSQREITVFLDRQRASRAQSVKDAQDRVRNSNAPTTVP